MHHLITNSFFSVQKTLSCSQFVHTKRKQGKRARPSAVNEKKQFHYTKVSSQFHIQLFQFETRNNSTELNTLVSLFDLTIDELLTNRLIT